MGIEGKRDRRKKRRLHIRKKIAGTSERPRMSVFRSNRRIYIQVVDDLRGVTIVSASNLEQGTRDIPKSVEGGQRLGEIIAGRLKEKSIQSVVFDRGGYRYHGIIKAVADGAREAGIIF